MENSPRSSDQHRHDNQPADKQGNLHGKHDERKEQHASHGQPPVNQADSTNLVGRIQERYGIGREEADRRVKRWMDDRAA